MLNVKQAKKLTDCDIQKNPSETEQLTSYLAIQKPRTIAKQV